MSLASKGAPIIVENESDGYWKDSYEDEEGIEILENTTVYAGDAFLASIVNGTNWTKQGLAVDVGSPGEPDDFYAFQSSVIKDEIGYYKMWYSGNDGSNARILYATSVDSVSWTKAGVIIDLGPPGSFDDVGLNNPRVLKDTDGQYELWYEGNDGSNSRILNANSTNGITWNKVGIAIDVGNPGQLDDERVRPSTVLKASDGNYKMWYDGFDGSNYRIFYATSTDGISWDKQGMVLQLGNPGDLDDTHIGAASVILDIDGLYKMWYSGYDGSTGYRLFYATSLDGVTWTKHGLVLDLGAPGEYDEGNVLSNCIIKDNDGINKIWYHGGSGSYARILYATSRATYNNTGNIISEKISLPHDHNWDKIIINKTELGTNNYINVSILDGETNAPILGFENLKGTNIDISSINYVSHPTIKLYANFVGNCSATPILHYWEVTWADTIPPATPLGFRVNNPMTGYSLILSWNPNIEPDFTRYVLFYSTDNITFFWLTNISMDTLSFIHYGLAVGITYYYKIAAADEVPNQSPFSGIVSSTPDIDTDNDGIGNNADPDDDNDGIPDISDPYPFTPITDVESIINLIKTLNEIQNRTSEIQLDLNDMNASLKELRDEINNLNQTITTKIDNFQNMLIDLEGNLSGYNQSVANDIILIINEIDKLKSDVSQKLENINNSLNKLSKLDNIISDLNTLNQSMKTMEDDLQKSIEDVSSEESIGLIWITLMIIFIILIFNLLLTLILIKRLGFDEQRVISEDNIDQEKVQELPPPPPDSPLE